MDQKSIRKIIYDIKLEKQEERQRKISTWSISLTLSGNIIDFLH